MARETSARVRTLTQKFLHDVNEKLDSLRGEIAACADSMDAAKFKEITFDGGGKADRGIDLIVEFVASLESAIKIEKHKQRR